jgi:two-component system, sensor histidine kinase and response regulator
MAEAKTAPQGDPDSERLRELKLTCMANLLAAAEERVYFKDLESRFLFVSAGWLAAYAPGQSSAELAGKTDFDVFSHRHAADTYADEQQIIHTGKPIAGQVERETYTGRPDAWVSTTKMPLLDDSGQIIGTFGISRDVRAQVSVENTLARQASELSAQNERLRELDRLKDEFIAAASHELRTPLTSIIGYIELLEEEGVNGPNTGRFAEIIGRNAEQLLRLVGDLLFLSRTRSGQLALEYSITNLAEAAAEAVAEARPEAQRKQIDFTLNAPPVQPFSADPARVSQLLGSLISNAVKFTRDGGRVEVVIGEADGQALITVTDTGPGIPAADLERIFERFYRTAAAIRQVIPGTGLGLAIAKAVVAAHHGSITVDSTEGIGSMFTATLPLLPVPTTVPAPGSQVPDPASQGPGPAH